ncbi:MAG: hypothetical protein GWN79_01265, partial [Actinobacteria bacterium]|nr:hypothetical protein [Actinomycetota bacterium]NIU17803.1 hypothetical protein [Actinomycetota bacterium]NIV54306.1 hypothetical protein [Actinomycetota bacterium]NIX49185.1 hypothetical protein [Actinomycetota bacterium]
EIRWRLEPDDVARLSQAQRRLLEAAADRVAAGGRLVYSVCSLEAEEGERRVRRFLDSRPDFRLADAGAILPAACGPLVADG